MRDREQVIEALEKGLAVRWGTTRHWAEHLVDNELAPFLALPPMVTDEQVERATAAYLAHHNAREVPDRSFRDAVRAALEAALREGT